MLWSFVTTHRLPLLLFLISSLLALILTPPSSLSYTTTLSPNHLIDTNQSYLTTNMSSHTNKTIYTNEERQRLARMDPENYVLSDTNTVDQREQLIEEKNSPL